jgi:hypothetical protein
MPKHNTMKPYIGVNITLQICNLSTGWSSWFFYSRGFWHQYSLVRRINGPQTWYEHSGWQKNADLARNWLVNHPVASSFSDWFLWYTEEMSKTIQLPNSTFEN